MSQTTMSIRVDSNLKQKFDNLCNEFGLSVTSAFTIFMNAVVRERRIPFEIKTDSIKDVRKRARLSYERMRADAAAAGIQDMSLEEINEIIKEVRYGEK